MKSEINKKKTNFFLEDGFQENKGIKNDSPYQNLFKKIAHFSPEVYAIFDIARIINGGNSPYGEALTILQDEEESSQKQVLHNVSLTDTKNTGNEENFVEIMTTLTEFPKILKKQFMFPDEIFMQKLIFKDLLVHKSYSPQKTTSFNEMFKELSRQTPEKEARKQRTYILLDNSKSTEKRSRLLLEKAIAFSFLENNNKEHGEVYFRTFNHELGRLFLSKNPAHYKKVLNRGLIPVIPEGSTNLQNAILQAIEDINFYSIDTKAEMLILTDGLTLVDPEAVREKSKGIKIHVVLIGNDEIYLSDEEFDLEYQKINRKNFEKLDQNLSNEEIEKRKREHKKKYFSKEKVVKEIKEERYRMLHRLVLEHSGKFIHIDDLPPDLFDFEKIIQNVQNEIQTLEEKLLSGNYTPKEKEEFLEQYLALKNYINGLKKNRGKTASQQEKLDGFSKQMKNFIQNNEVILDLIRESNTILQGSSKGMNSMQEMNLLMLFKLLFHKTKVYFFELLFKKSL
ncbi:VWA domain-containing protein [bacterium]|nr:VWA domain-containing protein [bacterium]